MLCHRKKNMSFSTFIPIILLLVFTERSAGDGDKCLQHFTKKGFVPKYADIVKSSNLQVQYAGKNLTCGSIANLVQTANPPTLYYNAPSCCKSITVIAFVADSPMATPWMFWLVINIPPDNLRKGFTTPVVGNTENNGDYPGSYLVPVDPAGSVATKTFVYFVYCQCGKFVDNHFYTPTLLDRGSFDIKGYAKKNRLGNPMAASYIFSTAGVDARNLTEPVLPDLAPQ